MYCILHNLRDSELTGKQQVFQLSHCILFICELLGLILFKIIIDQYMEYRNKNVRVEMFKDLRLKNLWLEVEKVKKIISG